MKVTMEDVAREAGVSRSLVSLAFRGAYGVNEATRDHILAVAGRMNYQPNSAAATLASRGTSTLGVFLLDLHNELFADVHDGIREVAGPAGRELLLTVGSIGGNLDRPALDLLVRARVDVVIAAGLLLSDDELAPYRRSLKLVSVMREVPEADNVLSDNVLGAGLAIDHLLGLGHRRIVHLASPRSDGYGGRREGYMRAMKQAGAKPRVVVSDYSRTEAAKAIAPVLDGAAPPTAIFAHNDQTALGVLDALHLRNLRVPEDVSVVGYDNTSASRPPGIALTTVDVHAGRLGRLAAEAAIARAADPAADPHEVRTTPSLVVRGTTAAPPR
ncbi:LacI family DNA-binding transcriptional regulator [Nakamurella sp. YIM 132087]|uniref:LacI family DNA-binding transcriptional regulator n=1 Tax=Nakamurella alba TaxID=2665158 RepID=A0A7K1FVP8_9ACTN|nr:LacI family DNA-binding transcriptional regulator [Nakamurella alba]MTD16894.1 LacI family DNA-binding transcriptional regulator [Nakamurella alba]